MENKLKAFLKSHLWLIILIALAALAFATFAIQSACETGKFNRKVDIQSNQSQKAVQEAVNANNAAVNVAVERRTEDARREQIIAPELNRRRASSETSKIVLQQARKTHYEKQKDTSRLSRSDADNCLRLKQLFPEVRFDDCR